MNFSFAHPWVLLLLVVPVALIGWEWSRVGLRHFVEKPLSSGKYQEDKQYSLTLPGTPVLQVACSALGYLLVQTSDGAAVRPPGYHINLFQLPH